MDLGPISVRRLELTEYFLFEDGTSEPSSALTFLRQVSLPDTTELVLNFKPFITGTFDVATLSQVQISDEMQSQVQHVQIELTGWEHVENIELLDRLFDQVAQKGGLMVKTELSGKALMASVPDNRY